MLETASSSTAGDTSTDTDARSGFDPGSELKQNQISNRGKTS
jgi:hypothetical protein